MNYNEVKFIAESKNYMIKDLAAELGMTSNGLKRSIEKSNLTMEKITTLCRLLEISPNEFFSWTDGCGITSNGNFKANTDLSSLMNILSRFLKNQEQYHDIMKDMMTIYEKFDKSNN